MIVTPEQACAQLRDARPATANTSVDTRALLDLERIVTAQSARPRRMITPWRAAVLAAVAAAVLLVGVVAWPRSDGDSAHPNDAAYAVTVEPDGAVHLKIFAPGTTELDSTRLQASLISAGVPATVLAASARGVCTAAPPAGQRGAGAAVTPEVATPPSGESASPADFEVVITPAAIPKGSRLLFITPGQSGFADVIAYSFYSGATPSCFSYPSSAYGQASTTPS